MSRRQATRRRAGDAAPAIRTKPTLNAPDDAYEQEADRIADSVMARARGPVAPVMTTPLVQGRQDGLQRQAEEEEEEALQASRETLQRQEGTEEEEEEELQTKPAGPAAAPGPAPTTRAADAVATGGRPLSPAERGYFEPRFGRDLGEVRIHTGAEAGEAARGVGARAYTLGRDIAFAPGQYAPDSREGRRLIAHELVHTLQQGGETTVRRYCDDPEFCTPYPTDEEADEAEESIWRWYMAAEGYATFGPEVEALYASYLNRSPGDSLDPQIIENEGSYIVRSFRDSGDVEDDMDAVLSLVEARISRAPGWPYRRGAHYMSLSNFLSQDELDNRPINFSNPFSVAGHIAGGIGSSDAGDDHRKIAQCNVRIEKVDLIGGLGYWHVSINPLYEVFDTIDFCPGDCGSPAEQLVTVPMSRLEAHGRAYDKPFLVRFRPERRAIRIGF